MKKLLILTLVISIYGCENTECTMVDAYDCKANYWTTTCKPIKVCEEDT